MPWFSLLICMFQDLKNLVLEVSSTQVPEKDHPNLIKSLEEMLNHFRKTFNPLLRQ